MPALGRWASADPLAVHAPGSADLNVYAYVHGQLLRATDPTGLEGIGGLIGPGAGPSIAVRLEMLRTRNDRLVMSFRDGVRSLAKAGLPTEGVMSMLRSVTVFNKDSSGASTSMPHIGYLALERGAFTSFNKGNSFGTGSVVHEALHYEMHRDSEASWVKNGVAAFEKAIGRLPAGHPLKGESANAAFQEAAGAYAGDRVRGWLRTREELQLAKENGRLTQERYELAKREYATRMELSDGAGVAGREGHDVRVGIALPQEAKDHINVVVLGGKVPDRFDDSPELTKFAEDVKKL